MTNTPIKALCDEANLHLNLTVHPKGPSERV